MINDYGLDHTGLCKTRGVLKEVKILKFLLYQKVYEVE